MELEEAIRIYNGLKNHKEIIESIDTDFFFKFAETVLQELKNSIPKKKIEDKKQWLEENILQNDYANDLDKDIAEYQANVLNEILEDK